MHHLRLIVNGRVQGVGFRVFASRRAQDHGLAGSVRNLADGGVEVEAEGDRDALERFAADLRQGPPRARVDHVEECWSEGRSRHRGFGITG